jgi:hypothetical protein
MGWVGSKLSIENQTELNPMYYAFLYNTSLETLLKASTMTKIAEIVKMGIMKHNKNVPAYHKYVYHLSNFTTKFYKEFVFQLTEYCWPIAEISN